MKAANAKKEQEAAEEKAAADKAAAEKAAAEKAAAEKAEQQKRMKPHSKKLEDLILLKLGTPFIVLHVQHMDKRGSCWSRKN